MTNVAQRVAVVIPAKDEARTIGATIRACRAIPSVDLVLVVDDGSGDDTQHAARASGAVVVRHSVNRGKASAMETGASVAAMRDVPDRPARHLLFIDADLGDTAVAAVSLAETVISGQTDCAIGVLPPQPGSGGRGRVVRAARSGIAKVTGWYPAQPLSGQRCITREAFDRCLPLAQGWGVEVGLTIDLLVAGFTVMEVPIDVKHRATGRNIDGVLHRSAQYRDVLRALTGRRLRSHGVPKKRRSSLAKTQSAGEPYRAWALRDENDAGLDDPDLGDVVGAESPADDDER